mgnify:FL=1
MMFMLDTGPSLYVENGILTSVKPAENQDTPPMFKGIEIEIARQED